MDDEYLAIAKSAAWTWYQRGSGSEGKPMSEFNLTRTRRDPKPSRYKLEAIKAAAQESAAAQPLTISPLLLSPTNTDSKSALLDSYEIERISKQLDYYIEASNFECNVMGFVGGDLGHRKNIVSPPERDAMSGLKKNKKTKKGRMFWFKPVAAACGSRNDVVEFARGFRDGRLPEKTANSRPRSNRV